MDLACGTSVCVAARRLDAARELVAQGCQVILCDDGLQHLALRRDLEIAVVDAGRGLGNGWMLPAGPLREPARRLGKVDMVVLNGTQTPDEILINPLDWYRENGIKLHSGERVEAVDRAAKVVMSVNGGNQTVPTLKFADGSTLTNPSARDVTAKLR